MSIVVIICGRSKVNDELVAVAGSLAESRWSDLLLLGVADVPPWIKTLAPLAGGHFCVKTASIGLQTEIEIELRRCIALVPATVAARHACFTGWNDQQLWQLLGLEDRPSIIAALAGPVSRNRRKLQALVTHLSGVLVLVQTGSSVSAAQPELERDVARSSL